ncbi:collagen-like protein [Lactiplantibacillus paraplantarum]|uniref:collagen-like protein n=1 Tax=Lactiplantibacillus paraplantarum TaxID=60520 RepID=UPI002072D652|nr:collagen-like protein [Lactiplantibacillus paraplantarum]
MEKTLSFTDTSSQTVKIGDTTTSFTLVCGNDNTAVDLTHATSITVKLGNDSGYLKSIKIEPSRLTEPTAGKITVNFSADLINSLPAGRCVIEVWVIDNTGISIYPSNGSTGFTITNNIENTSGNTIARITFDEFVEAMNKAASTINNDGLTKAPDFVKLQTQVNNSAVGTNLIVQSDLKSGYLNRDNGGVTVDYDNFHSDNYVATNGETVFTFSSPDYAFKGDTNDTLAMYDSKKKFLGWQSITSATQTLSKSNVAYIRLSINFVKEGGTTNHLSDWLDSHRYKLEKGSVATDWCPNPSDILTQSDYAKIKAAIVSLGGHLS